MFTALLDTCVLWPSRQRDFLLSLAAEGLYRPVWSSRILAELAYAEADKHRDHGVDEAEACRRAEWLIERMRQAFADAEIEGWEPLEGSYGLPDPDDEHVVAAAVVSGAGAIVTLNRRDFPSERLPFGLDVLGPAEFALNTVSINPGLALYAVGEMAQRSGQQGPTMSEDAILDYLVIKYGMSDAVDLMRR